LKQRTATGKGIGIAALVAIAIIATLSVAILASRPSGVAQGTSSLSAQSSSSADLGASTSTESPASSSQQQASTTEAEGVAIPSTSASSLNPSTGLSLNLNISTNSNEWVILTVYEFNTLDQANNVSAADGWPSNASLFQWVRESYEANVGMAGYEILQGNYGLSNFTQGTALWLQPPPSLLGCCAEVGQPDSYAFQPLSEANVLSGSYAGYFVGGSTYTPFSPGIYTVLAGDQWGDVAILHFAIQS
jgi:hypothetical protein